MNITSNNTSSMKILSNAVTAEYNKLIHTLALFFDYIILPRNGYLEVSEENVQSKLIQYPVLNDIMVNYVVQNILGINIDTVMTLSESNNTKSKNMAEIDTDFCHELSSKTQNVLASIYTSKKDTDFCENKDILLMTPQAYVVINKYIMFFQEMFLSNTENGELVDILESNITNWTQREGDNMYNPIDYRFSNDAHNIILQSFIWTICGLNDWLEKDILIKDDILYSFHILFDNVIDKPLQKVMLLIPSLENHINSNEYIVIQDNIAFSLYKNNFFISKSALELLTNILFNLFNNKDTVKFKNIYSNILIYSKQI